MKNIKIYTDGACSGNPGPGGWGAILIYNEHQKEISGFEPDTTNNRMEIIAAIEALKCLKSNCKIDIYTDSQYLKNGITVWVKNWKQKGWKLANSGKEPKNCDLWQELDNIVKNHHISWHWVKAHNGHVLNERADQLARDAIIRQKDVCID